MHASASELPKVRSAANKRDRRLAPRGKLATKPQGDVAHQAPSSGSAHSASVLMKALLGAWMGRRPKQGTMLGFISTDAVHEILKV
eukprot:7286225-Prymnesium_polylepis.1